MFVSWGHENRVQALATHSTWGRVLSSVSFRDLSPHTEFIRSGRVPCISHRPLEESQKSKETTQKVKADSPLRKTKKH